MRMCWTNHRWNPLVHLGQNQNKKFVQRLPWEYPDIKSMKHIRYLCSLLLLQEIWDGMGTQPWGKSQAIDAFGKTAVKWAHLNERTFALTKTAVTIPNTTTTG
jgi:hypothetical protein